MLTERTRRKIDLKLADVYSGTRNLPNDAPQTDRDRQQHCRDEFKDYLAFIAMNWVSKDLFWRLTWDMSENIATIMIFKVYPNVDLFIDVNQWDWNGSEEADGHPTPHLRDREDDESEDPLELIAFGDGASDEVGNDRPVTQHCVAESAVHATHGQAGSGATEDMPIDGIVFGERDPNEEIHNDDRSSTGNRDLIPTRVGPEVVDVQMDTRTTEGQANSDRIEGVPPNSHQNNAAPSDGNSVVSAPSDGNSVVSGTEQSLNSRSDNQNIPDNLVPDQNPQDQGAEVAPIWEVSIPERPPSPAANDFLDDEHWRYQEAEFERIQADFDNNQVDLSTTNRDERSSIGPADNVDDDGVIDLVEDEDGQGIIQNDDDSFTGVELIKPDPGPVHCGEYGMAKDEYISKYGPVFDNRMSGEWKGRFGVSPSNIPSTDGEGKDWQCPLCLCDIKETNDDGLFFSNEYCIHRQCPDCVWRNISTSPLPDLRSRGKYVIQKTGLCSITSCNEGRRCSWYSPNYCPFRPPGGQYVYGYIGFYRLNPGANQFAQGSVERRAFIHNHGYMKRWEMPITSPLMWNTYSEIHTVQEDKNYIPCDDVDMEECIKHVVYLATHVPPHASLFHCNMCNSLKDMKFRVKHCKDLCVNQYMCMHCACKLDKEGREKMLATPHDLWEKGTGDFLMSTRQEVSWKCPRCQLMSQFSRLDEEVLNRVPGGLYARKAFGMINETVRHEIGDTHLPNQLAQLRPVTPPDETRNNYVDLTR